MNTDTLMETVKTESNKAQKTAQEWAHAAQLTTVKSDEDFVFAGQCLQEVKGKTKELEEQRAAATRPLAEAQRTITSWFRPALESLAAAELAFKKALGKYEQDKKIAAESAMKAAAAAQTPAEMVREIHHAHKAQVPKVAGLSSRETWRFDVVDESELPREYMTPDLKKIGAVVRSEGRNANIPGVRVRAEIIMASRAAQA